MWKYNANEITRVVARKKLQFGGTKMKPQKMSVLILCMIIMMLGLTGCKKYSCEKLSSLEDIPEVVREKLSQANLTSGVYFFSSDFTNESSYVVVCGETGQAGYDADIEVVDYISLTEGHNTTPPPPIFGIFKIEINEEPAQTRPEYSSESDYSYVVYKFSGHVGKQSWVRPSNSESLTINNWWGRGLSEYEATDTLCEVIENEEDIPDYILQYLKRTSLSYSSILPVQPPNSPSNIRWLIITGEKNTPFRLSIEDFEWRLPSAAGGTRTRFFDLVLRTSVSAETELWNGSAPFKVIKVQSKKYESIQEYKVVVFDDNLNWSIK